MSDPVTAPLPDDYRDTELGLLPKDWQVVRLGEVATIGSSPVTRERRWLVPFIPMSIIPENGLFVSQWELRAPEEVHSSVIVSEGDFLLAKITPCLENGKQGIVKGIPEGWGFATTEVFPIRTTDNLNAEFLGLYLLQPQVRKQLAAKMEGTTGRQRLSKQAVLSSFIPLPPLAEQQAIARVLRTVQGTKEATEGVIVALRDLKRSLMRHLFTHGPAPIEARDRLPRRDTELGSLPAHWQVVRLVEVVEQTEQRDPRRTPDRQFKYVDVSCIDNDSLEIVNYQICTGQDAPSRARKVILEGDVIFATVRPYLKRIAIVPRELDHQICSTAFCVLRANPALIDEHFLFHAVSRDEFVTTIAEYQRGSSYPAVTDNDVKRGLIPLPPLAEQREIARILQAVDERIAAERAYARALGEVFRALLRDLMTARRRVPPDGVAEWSSAAIVSARARKEMR